jgi:hypothetical protein
MSEYVEVISMNLNDPNLQPRNGTYQSLDPGTYEFAIEKTATAVSQGGNNTLKVTARVIGPEGSPMMNRTITQTFVVSDAEWARARMLGFIQGVNCPLDNNGSFHRDALVGLQFIADVIKRPAKTIDKTGQEVEREFTEWTRERPIEVAPPARATASTPPPRRGPSSNRPLPPR